MEQMIIGMARNPEYQGIIEKLQLEPHPEGGYYRQLYGDDNTGKKDISTIYYMLTGSEKSAFHRLHGMTEIWYYHAGEPLNLYVIDAEGNLVVHELSPTGEMQVVTLPEQWFAAEIPSKKGFCLVGCAVAPAFSFENFELGHKDTLLQQFPKYAEFLGRLCSE
jgi:predicted cupin superfamily sugar epimerase